MLLRYCILVVLAGRIFSVGLRICLETCHSTFLRILRDYILPLLPLCLCGSARGGGNGGSSWGRRGRSGSQMLSGDWLRLGLRCGWFVCCLLYYVLLRLYESL